MADTKPKRNSNISWKTLTRTLLSILLILLLVLLVAFAVWPVPVKPILKRIFPTPDFTPSSAVTDTTKYSAFYGNTSTRKPNLLIVAVGGSFLLSNLSTHFGFVNELYNRVSSTFDVLLVGYPTRFRNTLRDMMLSINGSVSKHTQEGKYASYHAVGFSAGALLLGTFERKERDAKFANDIDVPRIGTTISSFVSICGLLEPKFNVTLYDALYSFYIARGTPAWNLYTCYGMQIPRLIVTANGDLLFDQSLNFLSTQAAKELVFRQKLPHTFAQNIKLSQSLQVIDTVAKFLKPVSNAV